MAVKRKLIGEENQEIWKKVCPGVDPINFEPIALTKDYCMRLLMTKERKKYEELVDTEKWHELQKEWKQTLETLDKKDPSASALNFSHAWAVMLASKSQSFQKYLEDTIPAEWGWNKGDSTWRSIENMLWKATNKQKKEQYWTFDEKYTLPFQREDDAPKRLALAQETFSLLAPKEVALYEILRKEYTLEQLSNKDAV